MGVPSFYRWLVSKYPKTVVNAIDEGESCDSSQPNPNGEFDNLYLDMNGIIHPCFHPDDELNPPSTFDEVFMAIFEYIDRLFRIVRPRKLLYMAVDGVAPRAKMNQQRARRFRTAKDAELAGIEEERLRRAFQRQGKELLPELKNSDVSDSNVITPGTVFMQKLSMALQYYIRLRLNNDPGWKKIKVILSDANVTGEGEHKIMTFVRIQRSLPSYDHNTHHCLYGLDADLIMLALATHEIHFSILREDILMQHHNQDICLANFMANSSQKEEPILKSRQWFKNINTATFKNSKQARYQFLNIWTLREYLELDMKPQMGSSIDFERIVDDFVFLCFFAGNDFLPHLPSLEIHEGAMDLLIAIYKERFNHMAGYLVDTCKMKDKAAYINLKRVEMFMMKVGSYEERIFNKRYRLKQKKLQRLSLEMGNTNNDEDSDLHGMDNFSITNYDTEHLANFFSKNFDLMCPSSVEAGVSMADPIENTKEFRRKMKQFLRDSSDVFKNGVFENDKVQLSRPGWKSRYYKEKFAADRSKDMEEIRRVVEKYVEGLCWILQYYYSGVCSWSWYYPFYYGPFASDFKNLPSIKVTFRIGRPFRPFDQLMAVLPPRSSHALPTPYRSLMIKEDSALINFYPKDFMVDLDGKRFTWQGICKLPFINEELLLCATKKLNAELHDDELLRNGTSHDRIFTTYTNPLADQIRSLEDCSDETQKKRAIVDVEGCDLNGFLSLGDSTLSLQNFTYRIVGMGDIFNDFSRCALYFHPEPVVEHVPNILEKTILPEKSITEADIVERKLWHECYGPWPQTIDRQKFVSTEEGSKATSPSSAKVMWKGAGNGWSNAERGKRDDRVPISASSGSDRFTRPFTGGESSTGRGHGRFQAGWVSRADREDGLRRMEPTAGFRCYGPNDGRGRIGSSKGVNRGEWRDRRC